MTTKYLYPILIYNGEGRHGVDFCLFEDKTLAELFQQYQRAIDNYVMHQDPIKVEAESNSDLVISSPDFCTVENIIRSYMESFDPLEGGLGKNPILLNLLKIADYSDDEALIPKKLKYCMPELLDLIKEAREL